MILLDLSHTSHTHARTGIQRVCRSLHSALPSATNDVAAITHDPFLNTWRPLAAWETAVLSSASASPSRGARWPLSARLGGRASRWLGLRPPPLPSATALIAPEIFSATTARALPALFAAVRGPRIALFHDAIALKFPELTPSKTVSRFPAYLRELLAFDGIAAVSEDSRLSLVDYWRWLGAANPPPVIALPLAIDPPPRSVSGSQLSALNPQHPLPSPTILSVGSLEGRKNHPALLDACESLWARGLRFELRLIGLAHPQTGRAALDRLRALQSAGRPLRYDGPVDDPTLEAAYAACAFTVYPSICEGFGLPVLESLARRKPCICSARGALGESARGGGCLTVDTRNPSELASAIARLLEPGPALASLSAETARRTFKTWPDYARELSTWMHSLPRRPA